jgi:hypothetical protein
MDPSKFDVFTKALATATSRRQALKAIGATVGGYLVSAELVQPWRSARASAKIVPSPVSAALATAIPVPLLVHVPLALYPAAIRVSPTSARMGRSSIPAPVSALAQPA